MAREDITQDVVLQRFVERLRGELGLENRQCFETADALTPPRIPIGGDFYVVVSGGDDTFETGEQASPNVTVFWDVYVTFYNRIGTDQTDHAEELMRNIKRGLLSIKRKVLVALIGHDLTTTDDETTFLRQLLYAKHCTRANVLEDTQGGGMIAMMTLTFGVDFDWDIDTSDD